MTRAETERRLAEAFQASSGEAVAEPSREHGEHCGPEACDCFRRGLESVTAIRCTKHYAALPQGETEECGRCMVIDADHEWAQWFEKWKATLDTYGSLLAKAEKEASDLREQRDKLQAENEDLKRGR